MALHTKMNLEQIPLKDNLEANGFKVAALSANMRKKGLGYNVVPLPHPLIYNRSKKLDLSYSGLDEFKEPKFKAYGSENYPVSDGLGPQMNLIFLVLMCSASHIYGDTRILLIVNAQMHMTGNIAYLSEFKEFDRGYVTFGGGAHGGRISGKGTLKTDSLDFEDVYFVNELKFNLLVSHRLVMCDKKNYVLFTNTECLVLSPNFKLPDESQIHLKILRKDNMYNFDMKNIVPKESLTCLVVKATSDESCSGIGGLTLFMLHMDLFGPTFVSSLMHKKYCLVVTDDYSRFSWVFFLATKDETCEILKNFINEIENLVDKKVKIIRSDNGTEFKNKVMDDFCREKGIKREYSVARTPQQNGVAERMNRTLIEDARTMLADFKLPTTFWAEAVSTTCYVH
ncbi:putative ribonuclease H-like domain-containing protein, partial [Tanacetum coccineum]